MSKENIFSWSFTVREKKILKEKGFAPLHLPYGSDGEQWFKDDDRFSEPGTMQIALKTGTREACIFTYKRESMEKIESVLDLPDIVLPY